MSKTVTPLEEIRAQVEPEVITLPGFRAGTTINVRVRPIDLTPQILALRAGNPLIAEVKRLHLAGMSQDEIAAQLDRDPEGELADVLPLLDAVARETLVEPAYEDITAICPLTFPQKFELLKYATGEPILGPFRQ